MASSLLSWPHRPISLTFQPKNPSPATARVSVQDPPSPPSPEANPTPKISSSSNTRYLWVNPNSARAAGLARARAGSSRRARLAAAAAALAACEPEQSPVAAALVAAFPLDNQQHQPASEQDAVIVLNTAAPRAAEVIVLALRWFLRNAEVRNEAILYNVVLKALRKRRQWGDAEALWEEMLREGVRPDNATFSTIISCARACGMPAKAVEWFEKMPEFGCSPDMLTYSVVIDAYGRAGDAESALRLYDRARAEKWQLDPVICATVIRVHATSGNFDGALNVFEEMKAAGVKPNLVVYNTVLDAMGRAMRPWVVKTIHRELVSQGVAPSKATYSCLLQAYTRARYGEDAMAVYRMMKDEVMDIDVILYNMLLSMCADIGYVDEAEEIFRDMKAATTMDARSKPDSWSYSSMVTLYSCTGDVAGAEGILNEMVEAGFKPNIFILTSLIRCYGKASRTDDVVRSFAMLEDLGITPDDRFCGCLLTVAAGTPSKDLDKVIGCIERSNAHLGSLVKLLVDPAAPTESLREAAGELLGGARGVVKMPYCNCLMDLAVNLSQMEKACALLDVALRLGIYTNVQTRTQTQWSLHLRGLSVGAALTTLHVWMSDLDAALRRGEELPPLLGIHTGQGKNMYTDRGLATVFEAHLKELDAPFHEAPDKAGWFLTTSVVARHWLETKKLAELVAV